MEQRNGRIDRKLQPHAEVYCHYFVYQQRPEDRILTVLVRKTETIKKELGSLSQVIDQRLDTLMKHGIRRDADRRAGEGDRVRRPGRGPTRDGGGGTGSARERQDDLRKQIDHLRTMLAELASSHRFHRRPLPLSHFVLPWNCSAPSR